jgi:hypothetical protein
MESRDAQNLAFHFWCVLIVASPKAFVEAPKWRDEIFRARRRRKRRPRDKTAGLGVFVKNSQCVVPDGFTIRIIEFGCELFGRPSMKGSRYDQSLVSCQTQVRSKILDQHSMAPFSWLQATLNSANRWKNGGSKVVEKRNSNGSNANPSTKNARPHAFLADWRRFESCRAHQNKAVNIKTGAETKYARRADAQDDKFTFKGCDKPRAINGKTQDDERINWSIRLAPPLFVKGRRLVTSERQKATGNDADRLKSGTCCSAVGDNR